MLSVNLGTSRSLLSFSLRAQKRDQRFLSGPSQKVFCFSSALTRCLSTTQVQIPKSKTCRRQCLWHSPKTRHAVTVLFWPLERQKTPEFRGFFGVASFKMCNHGAGGRTRTGTVSLPMDFESITSANSITPAYNTVIIHQIAGKSKHFF